MGDIKKPRKQYSVPRKRWDKTRIESEKKLVQTYGLKSKKELRRFETILRKKRENARGLLALAGGAREKAEKELPRKPGQRHFVSGFRQKTGGLRNSLLLLKEGSFFLCVQ